MKEYENREDFHNISAHGVQWYMHPRHYLICWGKWTDIFFEGLATRGVPGNTQPSENLSYPPRAGNKPIQGEQEYPNPSKLENIFCARFILNMFQDKAFESCVEFFPYCFSCWDHRPSSPAFFITFIYFTSLIVHLEGRDFTGLDAILTSASKFSLPPELVSSTYLHDIYININ